MKPSAIIIHCSDSRWGNAWHIDTWHRDRGFQWPGGAIGYHWVVCNGRISPTGR